ncbi:dioxygenase family protein [Acinetobacter larvae]|uniref:Dioxygenase n=1 Tax=Acinetobacter larvae TaxID=1789224 RepID=A0A1B2LY51_9GAMM|nr:class III extradiol ring-cleavage dioxygenase [Acinetobacter larvae]AOA57809.1 dioxygenase [Acinetobacter larvae]
MHLQTLPGLFISHGSPMLAIDPEQVGPALHRLSTNLPRPKAIVVMSSHWESNAFEISSHSRPETWHDFRGFPEPLYQIRYPAPGSPALAEQMIQLFSSYDFVLHPNSTRPRDHGVWVPLLHMYPDADIPVLELSLPRQATAEQLFEIGQIIAPLRQQQILIIGSGSITHNLSELSWQDPNAQVPSWASDFRNYVAYHLKHGLYEKVLAWQSIPEVQRNHPSLEHLAPLFFAMGTGSISSIVHSSFSMGALGMDIYRFDS